MFKAGGRHSRKAQADYTPLRQIANILFFIIIYCFMMIFYRLKRLVMINNNHVLCFYTKSRCCLSVCC